MSASPSSASSARPGAYGLLVKLRPSRPWRSGPASGARERVDLIYHSDTLFSAVTHAMRLLGRLEHWLEVAARADCAEGGAPVRFSSLFPFFGETLYATPPRHIWPPTPSVRVHYQGARFIPLTLVESIFAGKPLQDDRWTVDGVSECLVPTGKSGPFRIAVRSSAAVDRLTGNAAPHRTACLEFVPKAGLWFAISFADETTRDQWSDPVRAAIRLLADSGFGGERSRGWGRCHTPEFREGKLPQLIYRGTSLGEPVHWLLSLVTPSEHDRVEWDRGSYSTAVRGGRIESPAASGSVKKLLTVITEGSVLAGTTLEGSAPDVAPDGFPHPVYHAAWAFAISVPAEVPRQFEPIEPPPMDVAETEALVADEAAGDETPLPAEADETVNESSHLATEEEEESPIMTALEPELAAALPHELPTPYGAVEAVEETEELIGEDPATLALAAPQEIPTPDEELEQLEYENNGGPDDDVAPPMHDPGPMEPPFTEPDDLTPIDPDPGPGGEESPAPNPDDVHPDSEPGPSGGGVE